MISWVIYVAVGLIVGGAAGYFFGRLDDLSRKERQAMQERLDKAEKQMASYKHEVTEHFIETAGLINNMTESYQAVHEHLAKGALSLCDHQVAVKRLQVTTAEPLVKTATAAIDSINVAKSEPQTPMHHEPQSHLTESQIAEPSVTPQEEAVTETTQNKEEQTHVGSAAAAQSETQSDKEAGELMQETAAETIAQPETEPQKQEQKQEAKPEETEEQKALAEKQAAAMASRMVH